MPITPIPTLDRTSPTFKADVDTFFGSQLPAFAAEANALQTDVTTKQGQVAASQTAAEDSEANALASKNAAATSEANAATSASGASGSASAALASKNAAATSEANASSSATAAAASAASVDAANLLTKAGNLAGLTNPAAARANLGVDLFANLSASEVAIAVAVTLTAGAFGRMHVCSGTTANYTVSLPAASGNAGKIIGFRMAPALTKIVTLDANASELIDGTLTRVMWASEVAILMCDGAAWTKIAGKSLSMSALLANSVDQTLSPSTFTKITLSNSVVDVGEMAEIANSKIRIKRAGNYQITGQIYYRSGQAADTVLSRALKNGSVSVAENEFGIFSTASWGAPPLLGTKQFASDDVIELYGYHSSAASRGVLGGSCFLSIEEKLSW